jgi:FixJ family two-component response regulator
MARILVIDDEGNIRKMIGLALKQAGHVVDAAPDGRLGLNMYENGDEYDLVLLDQRMPEMDGIEVLHEMRRRNPGARVIMITAFGTIDLAVDAMRSGAADFLRKPFTVDTLRGAVQSALNIRYEPEAEHKEDLGGLAFGLTTLNGYHIESKLEPALVTDELTYSFAVRNPTGEVRQCGVSLAAEVLDAVKAHVGAEEMPGGDRFWHALAEHVLADYLWQNADFPPDDKLHAKEFSTALRSWVDAVVKPDQIE